MPYIVYTPTTVRPPEQERKLNAAEWLVSLPLDSHNPREEGGERIWYESSWDHAPRDVKTNETLHWVKRRRPDGFTEPVFKFPLPFPRAFQIALEHNAVVNKLLDNKL